MSQVDGERLNNMATFDSSSSFLFRGRNLQNIEVNARDGHSNSSPATSESYWIQHSSLTDVY